jgi:hypothetical protein
MKILDTTNVRDGPISGAQANTLYITQKITLFVLTTRELHNACVRDDKYAPYLLSDVLCIWRPWR